MLKGRKYIKTDGKVATLWAWSPGRDVRGVDFSTTEGLSRVCRCPLAPLSVRQEDMERAQAAGFAIDMRVRVKRSPAFDAAMGDAAHKSWLQIGGIVYRIESGNADDRNYYLDLSQEVSDGTCRLMHRDESRDAWGNRAGEWQGHEVHMRRASASANRETDASKDALRQTASVSVRACDWGAGFERIELDRCPHTVERATSDGEWVEVTATRKVGDL